MELLPLVRLHQHETWNISCGWKTAQRCAKTSFGSLHQRSI